MAVEGREQVTRIGIVRINGRPEELDGPDGRRQPSMGGTSRVSREAQARIYERLGVKFPGATRPGVKRASSVRAPALVVHSSQPSSARRNAGHRFTPQRPRRTTRPGARTLVSTLVRPRPRPRCARRCEKAPFVRPPTFISALKPKARGERRDQGRARSIAHRPM
jgi:hypothetical protein